MTNPNKTAEMIAAHLIDSLKCSSPKSWMETLELDDEEEETAAAMAQVAAWLELGQSAGTPVVEPDCP